MFEQSLLLEPAGARKTGALATSLTIQTLAVGVLIVIPLLFSDRLPVVPSYIKLSLPAPPPPPPPGESAHTNSSSSSHRSLVPTKSFHAPRHVVALSEIPQVQEAEAPSVGFTGVEGGVPGGTGVSTLMTQMFSPTIPQPKPAVVDTPKQPAKPLTVISEVQAAKLLRKVIPVYPPLARQMRVSGTVRLMGVVAKDGTIQQLQVVSGHPLLVTAALDAVRQWVYRPTLLNGQPVEVIAPIDVIFSLSQ